MQRGMIVNWKDAVAIPSIPGSSIDAVNRDLVETSVVSRETVLQFKEYLMRSTDQASMSFEMAGMAVSVHLFLDMQYGVLVVNGGIFRRLPDGPGRGDFLAGHAIRDGLQFHD